MKNKFKIVNVLLLLAIPFSLLSCENKVGISKRDAGKAAEAYIDTYLGKDEIDYEKSGISKDEALDLAYKRDYHVVNLYSRDDYGNDQILDGYYEALKKVHYTIDSSENDEDNSVYTADVTVSGIDISNVEREIRTYIFKEKKERKIYYEEMQKITAEKAVELLRGLEPGEEKDIKLEFSKEDDGKLKLTDESIETLEDTLSTMGNAYLRFTGDIPEEFMDIENER